MSGISQQGRVMSISHMPSLFSCYKVFHLMKVTVMLHTSCFSLGFH